MCWMPNAGPRTCWWKPAMTGRIDKAASESLMVRPQVLGIIKLNEP